ncbi:MAG: class I SAM-dependent methyltransferase [Anaerolineae bacterium]
MTKMGSSFIPALKFHRLTSLYDPVVRWTTREETFKCFLVEQADLSPNQWGLDLACGTATLALLIRKTHPQSHIVGIDGDAQILEIALRKVSDAHVDTSLLRGLSFELPYADDSFSAVFSTLFFHHLTRENKQRTMIEVLRVLQPGAALYIADWGKAQNLLMRTAFLAVQLLDGFETTTDNVRGLLPDLLTDSGFIQVHELRHFMTLLGTISVYKALKAK